MERTEPRVDGRLLRSQRNRAAIVDALLELVEERQLCWETLRHEYGLSEDGARAVMVAQYRLALGVAR